MTQKMNSNNNELLDPTKPTIDINLPKLNQRDMYDVSQVGKEDLISLLNGLRSYLKGYALNVLNSTEDLKHSFLQFITENKRPSLVKDTLVNIYSSLTSDLRNILNLAKVDPRVMKAWQVILDSSEISSKTIASIIGREIMIVPTQYWGTDYFVEVLFSPLEVIDTFNIYSYSYGNKNYTLFMRPSKRAAMVKDFYGSHYLDPVVTDALHDPDQYEIEDFENEMVKDLTLLSGLEMTGSIAPANGVVTAARLKSIKKRISFRDYNTPFPDNDIDRTEHLLNAFHLFQTETDDEEYENRTSPDDFGWFVVYDLPLLINGARFSAFIPEFKGFIKSWAGDADTKKVTEILSELLLPSAEGWMSLSNLKMRYLCYSKDDSWLEDYNVLFSVRGRLKNTLQRRESANPNSKPTDWFDEIDFRFIISWLRLLCGCGLFELAIKKGWEHDDSANKALHGISYVRMTSLGKYVFGLADSYKPKEDDIVSGIDVDSRNGILTLKNTESPYAIFLSKICKPISPTRFLITPETIIKGCKDANEVQKRLNSLTSILDEKSLESLGTILDETKKRINCLLPIGKFYAMLKLNPDIPEIVELIINNKKIRSKVILAEQSILLVERDFYPELVEICRDNGFILEASR